MSDICPIAASFNAMSLEDQPKTIGGSLLWLLQSKKLCDVTFTFPNLPDRIVAHENILAARSPVLEQLFRKRKSENVQGNEIEISDCTPERFQQFIEFIYSDIFEVDITGALELLKLSYKYKVQPLTMKCEELLQSDIETMGCVKVFETARRYGRRDSMDRVGPSMVKSFLELVATGAMVDAEEETLVYLLESDDLDVKEIGLFHFILDWGRKQVGTSSGEKLIRSKLRNLISKIRYTNMDPYEFTKMVIPTGWLSAEKIISVYSYFSGDEITRRDLKINFNTSHRKAGTTAVVATFLDFGVGQSRDTDLFPAFSKHSISFKVDRTQVYEQVLPDYLLKKTVITKVHIYAPNLNDKHKSIANHFLNLNVSVGDHSGPVQEGNFTIRFQKNLLTWKKLGWNEVSVEPPLELMFGRTYSVIVENLSTVDLVGSFGYFGSSAELADSVRMNPGTYCGPRIANMNREAHTDLDEVRVSLKEICRKTNYYAQNLPDFSEELLLIRGVEIGLK